MMRKDTNLAPTYHPQEIAAHGSPEATAFLVNEAPGDCEAYYGLPSVASQGGNIYRALRDARVQWALDLKEFSWPTKIQCEYVNPYGEKEVQQFIDRDDALAVRARYITCTNAFDRWPSEGNKKFVPPENNLVRSAENMERLRGEATPNHRVLLICGKSAWLACHGTALADPDAKERTQLLDGELEAINRYLNSSFETAWYMGHTGRWNRQTNKYGLLPPVQEILKDIAKAAGWPLAD
jgi:hypothetical protein